MHKKGRDPNTLGVFKKKWPNKETKILLFVILLWGRCLVLYMGIYTLWFYCNVFRIVAFLYKYFHCSSLGYFMSFAHVVFLIKLILSIFFKIRNIEMTKVGTGVQVLKKDHHRKIVVKVCSYRVFKNKKFCLIKFSFDWGSIPAYIKNWLVSWFDDKELSSGADAIGWNSLKKKKKN